jgi:hypothetical protein
MYDYREITTINPKQIVTVSAKEVILSFIQINNWLERFTYRHESTLLAALSVFA